MIQMQKSAKIRGSGDRLPQVSFKLRRDGSWVERSSSELFARRRVVIFAVPGAFASACSGRHLPGYVALAGSIRRMGIDEIFCVSVNDAFVMNAWARDQGIDGEVTLLPDGNADFTRAMGMLADWSTLGFGPRSWRYSLVARDGVIERIFVEDPRHGTDPFAVSDAITLLDQLDSGSRRMAGE